jgi:hypothetical protein
MRKEKERPEEKKTLALMAMHSTHFNAMDVSDGVDCLPHSILNPYIVTINSENITGG